MSLVLLGAGLVVIAVVAALVTGRLDASLPAPVGSSPHRPLPEGRLSAGDVEGLRFSLAVRGYRMDEVDEVLDRLRAELAERDAALAAVTAPAPASATTAAATTTARTTAATGAAPATSTGALRRDRRPRARAAED